MNEIKFFFGGYGDRRRHGYPHLGLRPQTPANSAGCLKILNFNQIQKFKKMEIIKMTNRAQGNIIKKERELTSNSADCYNLFPKTVVPSNCDPSPL